MLSLAPPSPQHAGREPVVACAPDAAAEPAPPGALEVIVVLDEQPLAGALVRVSGTGEGRGTSAWTGADGWARLRDLGAGRYEVEAVLERPAATQSEHVTLEAGRAGERLLFEFGWSTILGVVRDERGEPASGRRVAVDRTLYCGERSRVATTDEQGAYRIGGLPPGEYGVTCAGRILGGIDVGAGATCVVDVGGTLPWARWSGALRLPSGAAPIGSVELRLRHVESGATSTLRTADDGALEALLEPGTYAVVAEGLHRALELGMLEIGTLEIGTLEIGTAPFERDLVLGGLTLAGTLSYGGSRPRGDELAEHAELWLRREGQRGRGVLCRRRRGERFAFYGLAPGRYELWTWPLPLAGFPDGRPLELTDARDELVVDLTLGDVR